MSYIVTEVVVPHQDGRLIGWRIGDELVYPEWKDNPSMSPTCRIVGFELNRQGQFRARISYTFDGRPQWHSIDLREALPVNPEPGEHKLVLQ